MKAACVVYSLVFLAHTKCLFAPQQYAPFLFITDANNKVGGIRYLQRWAGVNITVALHEISNN